MATKHISITEEAYARLARLREKNESFSEIINRVTGKQSLMEFAGVLSKESADELERHIKEFRARFQRDSRKRLRAIQKALRKDGMS